jgi:AraC-like DNA-binding protein
MSPWIAQPDIGTKACHLKAVTRVLEAIRNRPEKPLTLREMSKIALISRHHFVRVFHRLVGLPPNRYQWAMRLAYAKRLLVETDISVIDVCFEAGYNSLGSFTRRFTALVGIPPYHFRLAARSFDRKRFSELVESRPDYAEPSPAQIAGELHAPAGFDGWIFVSLFPAGQPHALPRAFCGRAGPGRYEFASVPDGSYRLSAIAVPKLGTTADYFIHDHALRASMAGAIEVRSGELVSGGTCLALRRPELTDLPILLGLVPLVEASYSFRLCRYEHAMCAGKSAGVNGFHSGRARIQAAGGLAGA